MSSLIPSITSTQNQITATGKSISQIYLPRYRRIQNRKQNTKQQNMPQLQSKIFNTINHFQQTMNHRMEVHETQLLNAIRQQITDLLSDIKKSVDQYQKIIKEKRLSQELRAAHNQMQYFRYESIKLFTQNKQLKDKIKHLQNEKYLLQFQINCKSSALKNVEKKLMKSREYLERQKRYPSQEQMIMRHKKRVLRLSQNCNNQIDTRVHSITAPINKCLPFQKGSQFQVRDFTQTNEDIKLKLPLVLKEKAYIKRSHWQINQSKQFNSPKKNANESKDKNKMCIQKIILRTPKIKKIEHIAKYLTAPRYITS